MISRPRRILLVLLVFACLLHVALRVSALLDRNRLDDDAYMFARYAHNLLHHGVLAWNPAGPATYGLTSLGYFLVVLLWDVALRADAAWVLLAAAATSGVVFLLLALLLAAVLARPGPAWRSVAALVTVALCLAWGDRGLANHFVTGMDATFALASVTLFLILAVLWFREPTRLRGGLVALAGGLLWWVRPDTLVFAFVPVGVVWLWPPSAHHRRAAMGVLAGALVVVLLLCAGTWGILHSPLPLPLYGKVLRGYGADMRQVYARFPAEQLSLFARDHAVALVLGVGGTLLLAWRRGREASWDVGLGLAAVVFVVFHRFFVLAIMGSHQRFYYPILPVALFLTVRVVLTLLDAIHSRPAASRGFASVLRSRAVFAMCFVAACVSLAPGMHRAWTQARQGPRLQHVPVWENYEDNWPSGYWIRLDGFSRLPDTLVLATTEVGYPGVMNPEKRIIDLAGLNDTEFARHGFSAAALFAREQPDLFLLPRSHYATLRTDLLRSAPFRSGYELFTPPQGLLLALRRDSPHHAAMRQVLGLDAAVDQ